MKLASSGIPSIDAFGWNLVKCQRNDFYSNNQEINSNMELELESLPFDLSMIYDLCVDKLTLRQQLFGLAT